MPSTLGQWMLLLAAVIPSAPLSATVKVFLDPECPLSQAAATGLNGLAKQVDLGVRIVGIIPRLKTDAPELATFRADQGVSFDLLGDPDLEAARAYGARVTPEVFLVDSGGKVIYRGAQDNRASQLGKKRGRPTHNYLDSALTQWREGRPVIPAHTQAVGCFIE